MEQQRPADGCLVGVVRAVALVVVVPLRFLWELLGVVLRALGTALYWVLVGPFELLWRYVLAPVGRVLIVLPLQWLGREALAPLGRWLYRWVLAPLGRGLLTVLIAVGAGIAWLGHYVLVVPLTACYRYVLTPIGRAVAWLVHHLLVVPVVWLVRHLLVVPVVWLVRYLLVVPLIWLWGTLLYPVLRVLGLALLWAWRQAGRLWRFAVVRPCRWVRREVWWPVKAEVRRVLREVRRALLG